jgi:hypothetical protein
VSFSLSLKAQPKGLVAVPGYFRVSIDENARASFRTVAAPPTTGIEPIFESGPPYEETNYHDTSLNDGGNVYRIGLRSLDKGTVSSHAIPLDDSRAIPTGGGGGFPD